MTHTYQADQRSPADNGAEIQAPVWLLSMLAATTLHHTFRFGPQWLWTASALFLVALALIALYRRTGSRSLAYAYGLFSALTVISFGILDGFLDHVLKVAGLGNLTLLEGSDAAFVETYYGLWSQNATYWFYEGTGITTFALSIPATWHTVRFMLYLVRR
jgi:hypothetical protein